MPAVFNRLTDNFWQYDVFGYNSITMSVFSSCDGEGLLYKVLVLEVEPSSDTYIVERTRLLPHFL